jgi:hypothetical protein
VPEIRKRPAKANIEILVEEEPHAACGRSLL